MPSRRFGFCARGLAAALTLLANCGAASATETCADGTVTSSGCDGLSALAQDLVQRRIDRTLATDPASDRFRRLNAPSSAGTGTATSPFVLTPDGDSANFKTSLTQWGAALSSADQEVLKDARKALDGDASLPQAVKAPAPGFDLWAQGRHESFSENATVTGSALTTYLGRRLSLASGTLAWRHGAARRCTLE
jgi:hypothetical protein